MREYSADKTLATLELVSVLSGSECFSTTVLSEVECSSITDLIDYQIRNNPVCMCATAGTSASSGATEFYQADKLR